MRDDDLAWGVGKESGDHCEAQFVLPYIRRTILAIFGSHKLLLAITISFAWTGEYVSFLTGKTHVESSTGKSNTFSFPQRFL